MTDLEATFRLLAQEGKAGTADDTSRALDALSELGLALVRNHIALEQRVTDLEQGRHASAQTGEP